MAGWKLRKEKTQAESPDAKPEIAAEPETTSHGAEIYSNSSMDEESSATAMAAEHAPPPDFETGDDLHFMDEDSPLKLMDYSAPFTEDLLPLSASSASPIIAAPPPDVSFDDVSFDDVPSADTPPTELPSADISPPEISFAEMPPTEMPTTEMPTTEMPTTEMPTTEMPTLEAPSAEIPSAEIPSAEMPTLVTPSFNTSTTELGDVGGDFTSTLRMSREELAAAFAPPPAHGIPTVAPFVLDAPLVSPAAEGMTPRLVVRMGRLSAAFDLTKEVTVIGRPDSEMHYYPDVEIDLDDAVSRRHAEVIKRDETYFLTDTGSTNGTLLNGEKLPAHEERRLTHGDRIRVGERTEIIFE